MQAVLQRDFKHSPKVGKGFHLIRGDKATTLNVIRKILKTIERVFERNKDHAKEQTSKSNAKSTPKITPGENT